MHDECSSRGRVSGPKLIQRGLLCWALLSGVVAHSALPDVVPLDRKTAIAWALENNYTVRIQQLQPEVFAQRLREAQGSFDPFLSLNIQRTWQDDQPYLGTGFEPDDLRFSQQRKADSLSLGVDGRLPWGTAYFLAGGVIQQESGTSKLFETFGEMGLRQPLLEGFGRAANLLEVRVARGNRSISDWAFRQTLMDEITTVANAYHALYLTRERLKVAERSRDLAERLLQENRRRVEIGSMAAADRYVPTSELALREEQVLAHLESVQLAETWLKILIFPLGDSRVGDDLDLAPPPDAIRITASAADALSLSLTNLPPYQEALFELENERWRLAHARNATLPAVDLFAAYRWSGYGEGFDDSRKALRSDTRAGWSVGLSVGQPIPDRSALARRRAAQLQVRQHELGIERLTQSIRLEVAGLIRRLELSWARKEASARARDLARQSLRAEEQKLEAGTSTTFVVLRLQADLAEAEVRELQAEIGYLNNLAEYHRLTGQTLDAHHVRLAPPEGFLPGR